MRVIRDLVSLLIIMTCYNSHAQECVVILHGFGKTNKSMSKIAAFLSEHDYQVINITYPSIKQDITSITEKHIKPLIKPYFQKPNKVHFVGYSMGGVITRHIIESNKIENIGNVVLIASPIQGSDLSSIIIKNDFLRWVFGPAVRDIATQSSIIKSLNSKPHYPVGIITASKSHNPITSLFLLKGPNDGTVTLASTKIYNANDNVMIDANHNSILYLKETQIQILSFLKNKRFIK
jgi:esterase/lipase